MHVMCGSTYLYVVRTAAFGNALYTFYTRCSMSLPLVSSGMSPTCRACFLPLPPAAHMFDRTSVVMLCMMTVAFLIPCALSYVPWPFLQPQLARPYASHADPALGRSTAVHTPSAAQRHAYAGDIPPRPAARVGPGS